MAKTGYFRWDVWKANLSEFGIDEHFVVIVSNFKSNTKNVNVQVCLITSKLKDFPNRVNVNILTPSQIKCDTILTIPKSKLLYKQSQIEDIFTQLEVEKQLEIQLQLSKNFINKDIEQIESFITKGINSMYDESQLVNLRNDICNSAVENKYEETIELCNKLIQIASSSNLENKNDYLWHSTYHRSLMFSKIGNHELSLSDARDALRYVPSLRTTISPKYGYTLWRLAICYENLDNIDSAVQIYKNLNIFYKKYGKENLRITMLYNIYKVKCRKNKMKTIIGIVEKMNFTERENDKTKENLLIDMRKDLEEVTNAIS